MGEGIHDLQPFRVGRDGGAPMTETMLDPQLTLLTPSAAFAGRVVELQISAAETYFDATSR